MRIRRSLTSTTSSAAKTTSDPDHNHNDDNHFTTPSRCSTINNNNTKTSSSIIICIFNQSPWDVNDLSSLQLDGGLFSLTGTVPVPELAIGSQSFGSSVKLCVEKTKQPLQSAAASYKYLNRRETAANSAGLSPPEVKIRAEKSSTNGKTVSSNKPQIRASSVKNQQMKSSTDSPLKTGMTRRGRTAKKSAVNPNEFYYYSGFGPHWGKKRETVTKSLVVAKVIVTDQELQAKNEGGTKRDIDFIDYDDDDDDIDGEENDGTRRPGGRKRVKARSLKSLM